MPPPPNVPRQGRRPRASTGSATAPRRACRRRRPRARFSRSLRAQRRGSSSCSTFPSAQRLRRQTRRARARRRRGGDPETSCRSVRCARPCARGRPTNGRARLARRLRRGSPRVPPRRRPEKRSARGDTEGARALSEATRGARALGDDKERGPRGGVARALEATRRRRRRAQHGLARSAEARAEAPPRAARHATCDADTRATLGPGSAHIATRSARGRDRGMAHDAPARRTPRGRARESMPY